MLQLGGRVYFDTVRHDVIDTNLGRNFIHFLNVLELESD